MYAAVENSGDAQIREEFQNLRSKISAKKISNNQMKKNKNVKKQSNLKKEENIPKFYF